MMPSVIDQSETAVPDGDRADMSQEELSRSVDLIIIRLRASGYKFREIAIVLNRHTKTVESRYRRIPDNVRRHYASVALG